MHLKDIFLSFSYYLARTIGMSSIFLTCYLFMFDSRQSVRFYVDSTGGAASQQWQSFYGRSSTRRCRRRIYPIWSAVGKRWHVWTVPDGCAFRKWHAIRSSERRWRLLGDATTASPATGTSASTAVHRVGPACVGTSRQPISGVFQMFWIFFISTFEEIWFYWSTAFRRILSMICDCLIECTSKILCLFLKLILVD